MTSASTAQFFFNPPPLSQHNILMTQLLSHASQSGLGETCAFYLAYIKKKLPTSLETIQDRFVTTFFSTETPLSLRSLTLPPTWFAEHTFATDKLTLAVTVFVCAIAVVIMAWGAHFSNFFRRSPQASGSAYGYTSPNDIVDPPTDNRGNQNDTEPDTLLLKHKRNAYVLNFPAYAINDGTLSVGRLRQRAAEATGASEPSLVKLLYKGKLLDNDLLSCRDEGLKQQSEVLCVVSEVGENTPSEESEAEDMASDSAHLDDTSRSKRIRHRNKNKKNKNKNKNKRAQDGTADSNILAPPAEQQKPSSSPGRLTLPAPSPNLNAIKTPLEQVHALTAYLRSELLPLCDEYIANPPADSKTRGLEYIMLSETIMEQVILKADSIDIDGNEDVRNARKALIRESQTIHKSLDKVKEA
ncbi:BAG domain-containing protein [Aspergillus coremiiformis]|uniref:BAG domain-containing protein n=1 Tax=Aspergillus coremiiformis TaxID=138285 RepID=A0A5N6Z5R5_9EURO|nr:BAG domain-containing protein [Aspergillus coremiiformis]